MLPPSPARSPLPAVRPSACPGLLRIVQALDGGICRIKLAGGVLSADQAEAVARAARVYAGGVIEATNRANLQIRGVGDAQAELVAALLAAGLGPRQAAADDVRNLMLSPAAGLDREQLLDVRPLAAQVLASLEDEPRFHALSAKFAVQLDGGERLAMLGHHHDLWLSPVHLDGALWMAFGLAGCPLQDAADGAVPVADAHRLVLAVLDRFLHLATADQHRLRDLPMSKTDFIQGLGVAVRPLSWRRPRHVAAPLGIQAQRQPGLCHVGAAAPLGRLDPEQLLAAAAVARTLGDGTLRFTPWQGVLLPNVAAAQAEAARATLHTAGWLTDAQAPLAHLLACTGAAGCAKGLADTKADAQRLAQLLPAPTAVHLSGCARSCAAAHIAPVTLLAVGEGRYDLYVRDATQPGFGLLRATSMTVQDASVMLASRSRSSTDD